MSISRAVAVPNAISVIIVLAALSFAGCGGSNRSGVSGVVTLDGKPVAQGSISFRPVRGTTGNTAGTIIANGEYAIPGENGLPPGQYTVDIEVMRKTGRKVKDPSLGMIDELARVEYSESGRLTATINAGKNEKTDFAITSRRPLTTP